MTRNQRKAKARRGDGTVGTATVRRGRQTITPILHARPLSGTPATCDLAPSVQRPSFRFHDPLGGVLKARFIRKAPRCKRWGAK